MKREKRKQLKTNDETISQKVRNKTKENEKKKSGFQVLNKQKELNKKDLHSSERNHTVGYRRGAKSLIGYVANKFGCFPHVYIY
jgi:hypothetical protein